MKKKPASKPKNVVAKAVKKEGSNSSRSKRLVAVENSSSPPPKRGVQKPAALRHHRLVCGPMCWAQGNSLVLRFASESAPLTIGCRPDGTGGLARAIRHPLLFVDRKLWKIH